VVHELIDKTAAKRQLVNWAILLWWVTVNSVDLKVQNICIDNSYIQQVEKQSQPPATRLSVVLVVRLQLIVEVYASHIAIVISKDS